MVMAVSASRMIPVPFLSAVRSGTHVVLFCPTDDLWSHHSGDIGPDVSIALAGEVTDHHVNKVLMFFGFLRVPLHTFLLAGDLSPHYINPAILEICQKKWQIFLQPGLISQEGPDGKG